MEERHNHKHDICEMFTCRILRSIINDYCVLNEPPNSEENGEDKLALLQQNIAQPSKATRIHCSCSLLTILLNI